MVLTVNVLKCVCWGLNTDCEMVLYFISLNVNLTCVHVTVLSFRGDEYQKHTKCISEDEKYGGKDYKPKPNANKGERKQEEWTDVSVH